MGGATDLAALQQMWAQGEPVPPRSFIDSGRANAEGGAHLQYILWCDIFCLEPEDGDLLRGEPWKQGCPGPGDPSDNWRAAVRGLKGKRFCGKRSLCARVFALPGAESGMLDFKFQRLFAVVADPNLHVRFIGSDASCPVPDAQRAAGGAEQALAHCE